ncbi:MAG: tripartite tricarboxylate transporter substrate binding protein [Proteobacteria bacterium]|nr:tripartite tricarboxylate transporter substrate binding protein [Pseudomonadota bacterium]
MQKLLISIVIAALTAPAWAATADNFPSKTVRIVVGFTPGTTTDITARALAQALTARLGQQVIVENREGANSGIANSIVQNANPDGHTVLMGTLSMVVSPLLYKELPFDPKALAPVSLVVLTQNVICVNPKVEATSIKELIALAKAKPGQMRYGSSGRGSSAFLTLELLKSMAGIDLQEIPYKSTSQAVTDLMSGEIPIYPPSLVSAIPLIKSGRIRAIAVTGPKRSSVAPDIPTVAETIPGYDAATGVYGLMVPAKTPAAIVDKLYRETVAVLKMPEFREKMQAQGVDLVGSTPAEYAAYLKASGDKWKTLSTRIGVGPQ